MPGKHEENDGENEHPYIPLDMIIWLCKRKGTRMPLEMLCSLREVSAQIGVTCDGKRVDSTTALNKIMNATLAFDGRMRRERTVPKKATAPKATAPKRQKTQGVRTEAKKAKKAKKAKAQKEKGRWSKGEHIAFLKGYAIHGKAWQKVATVVRTRTCIQTRTHAQKYFEKIEAQATQGLLGLL